MQIMRVVLFWREMCQEAVTVTKINSKNIERDNVDSLLEVGNNQRPAAFKSDVQLTSSLCRLVDSNETIESNNSSLYETKLNLSSLSVPRWPVPCPRRLLMEPKPRR